MCAQIYKFLVTVKMIKLLGTDISIKFNLPPTNAILITVLETAVTHTTCRPQDQSNV